VKKYSKCIYSTYVVLCRKINIAIHESYNCQCIPLIFSKLGSPLLRLLLEYAIKRKFKSICFKINRGSNYFHKKEFRERPLFHQGSNLHLLLANFMPQMLLSSEQHITNLRKRNFFGHSFNLCNS
jgi:hypothetical protein